MRAKAKENISFFLCFGLAVLFLFLAVREYAPYLKSDLEVMTLRNEVEKDPDGKGKGKEIDWDALKKTNPDIIAWIEVPGTKIDHPVLKSSEWNEYLHKDYKGRESYPGSLFVQPDCGEDFSDSHIVIYGHNMRNQSMFGSLHRFEKGSFWKEHREVFLYQPGKTIVAEVYSTYDCKDKSQTYHTVFETEEEWETWISMSMEGSSYDTGFTVKKEDKVVTLSTCAGGGDRDRRYVVHAVIKKEVRDVQ